MWGVSDPLARFNPAFMDHRLSATIRDLPFCKYPSANQMQMLIRLLKSLCTARSACNPRSMPDSRNLQFALGLQKSGDLSGAESVLREIVARDTEDPDALHLLGNNLYLQNRFAEALVPLYQVIVAMPDSAEAYFTLATVVRAMGRLELAIHYLTKALELRPNFMAAAVSLANVLRSTGRPDDAEIWYRRAAQASPHSAEALYNLANLLHSGGKIDEAIATYRRAIDIRPEFVMAHSGLVYSLNFHPGYTPEQIFHAHVEWARQHAEPLKNAMVPHKNKISPARILKIGYVSPNFRDHAVTYFFESVLHCHDLRQFYVVCYSDTIKEDQYTKRLKVSCAQWRDTSRLTDDSLASQIRQDEVDILVDLSGHTEKNRLLVFARAPAPVQVTWNGYANTTGMAAIDYRITDPIADPPGMTDHLHTEKLVRLPETYMVFRPPDDSPAVSELPAQRSGCITFGSFNALPKITIEVVRTWSSILNAIPRSRLLMAAMPPGQARNRILGQFAANGIDGSRVELHDKLPAYEFLELHRQVDIALDPFPFSGTTTTCHTLWMGVPIIALAGASHVSRVTASMLNNVGLSSLVAISERDYVIKATDLAGDIDRMAVLRRTMRDRMLNSPLADAPRFTSHLEHAYRKMWETWCDQTNFVTRQ
jgi:protein O-GlcNAc transferase